MALSEPRIIYGIHSMSPYRRSDGLPYGLLKVIGSANLSLSSEVELLYAGSNKAAWAAEAKTLSSEFTAKVKAYPNFLFELFLGATVTQVGVDSAGNVTALTNIFGTTAMSATIGIASVGIIPTTGAANLKFGKYVVKVVSASTVNIYGLVDIDFARGTDAVYQDDTLKLLAADVTITTGGNTDVAALGIRLVGGSGTIGMTVGDTAGFDVKPPSVSSTEIVVGASTTTFPSFGAVLLAQKRATGELFEIDALNCVASGLPIALEEQAFSQPEIKVTCLYDATKDAVFKIRHILPS